jgi:hypothetical protein
LQDTIFYKDDPAFISFTCIFFVATWYYGKKKINPWGTDLPCGFALRKGSQHRVEKKGPQGVGWTAQEHVESNIIQRVPFFRGGLNPGWWRHNWMKNHHNSCVLNFDIIKYRL